MMQYPTSCGFGKPHNEVEDASSYAVWLHETKQNIYISITVFLTLVFFFNLIIKN